MTKTDQLAEQLFTAFMKDKPDIEVLERLLEEIEA